MVFQLLPMDLLLKDNSPCSGPYYALKRWALGSPYDHIYAYLGKMLLPPLSIETPMLFESNGNGVVIQELSSRYGETAMVLRLDDDILINHLMPLLRTAVEMANDPQAKYDYMCICKYVLPRLLIEKTVPVWWIKTFGPPMPLSWHRDKLQICSEAILELFIRNSIPVLPYYDRGYPQYPPLPADFFTDSPILRVVAHGVLGEAITV